MKIRRSNERGLANEGWLKSRYSFSFANYHDDEWVKFGKLRVINEDWIAPGSGFPVHSHRDMEVVTIMLSGELHHRDSMGNEQVLRAGEVQSMSAGTGISHSEWNASETEEAHLYQIWISPVNQNLTPTYDQFVPEDNSDEQILVSDGPSGLDINQRAEISRINIDEGDMRNFSTEGEWHYIQIIEGGGQVGEEALNAGDAFLLEDESQKFTANESTKILLIKTGESK